MERVVDKRIRRRGRESCRGGVTRVGALLQRSVWLHLSGKALVLYQVYKVLLLFTRDSDLRRKRFTSNKRVVKTRSHNRCLQSRPGNNLEVNILSFL